MEGDENKTDHINQEFVDGMNQKAETRKLVPNKYQHQIHELTLKLEELDVQMNIKECENKLFKDNINTIQVQLQEKSNTINELNTIITTLNTEKDNKEKETTNLLSDANTKLANLQTMYDNLLNEHNNAITTQNQSVTDSSVMQTKYDELESKYNNMLKLYNDKVQDNNNMMAKFNKSQSELKLKQSSIQEIEDTVSIIKHELETTMNNNIILAKEIVEKDNYLKQLNNEINDLKKQLEETPTTPTTPVTPTTPTTPTTPVTPTIPSYKRNNNVRPNRRR